MARLEISRHATVSTMCRLIHDDNVEELELLLIDVVDMHVKAQLLAGAVKLNRERCIMSLLVFGADPFLKEDLTRHTALYCAVVTDNVAALKLLLEYLPDAPLDLSTTGAEQTTEQKLHHRALRAVNEALFDAASLGSIETAKYLVESGADLNQSFYHDDEFLSFCTPLIAACYIPRNGFSNRDHKIAEEMAKLLVKNGADHSLANFMGDTALHWAVTTGLGKAVRLLLRYGADVNRANRIGKTPLMACVDQQRGVPVDADIAQILIEWEARVNDVDKSGWSALCYAVNCENEEVTKMLLVRGAAVDPYFPLQQLVVTTTPLFIAVAVNNKNLARLLIQAGADVNRKAGIRTNPLSPFASCLDANNFDLARLLFNAGIDRVDALDAVRNRILSIPVEIRITKSYSDQSSFKELSKLLELENFESELLAPLSLKNHCRLVIRHHIANFDSLTSLPLPSSLISYLGYSDI